MSKNTQIKRSPFMLATVGGMSAVIADAIWLTLDLASGYGFISSHTYLLARLVVLVVLLVVVFVCILAMKKYIVNGYVRWEQTTELCSKRESLQNKKRNNIFGR